MSGDEMNPGAHTKQLRGKPRRLVHAEYYLDEMDSILYRMADLLRIVIDEIAVFEYYNEKYRLHDTDLDEI